MDGDTFQVDWALGAVVRGDLRFPATVKGCSGLVIVPEGEMLAATEKAEDNVLIAFGGLIGWIAEAAQNAFARNASGKWDEGFHMLIACEDFSFARPSRSAN